MSIYESSITNPKKQLEFYKDLSEQLQRENFKLQARSDRLTNNWNKLKETLKEEIKYDRNWYNPDCAEYIGQKRYPDDTIDGFRYVVEKMEDLERS